MTTVHALRALQGGPARPPPASGGCRRRPGHHARRPPRGPGGQHRGKRTSRTRRVPCPAHRSLLPAVLRPVLLPPTTRTYAPFADEHRLPLGPQARSPLPVTGHVSRRIAALLGRLVDAASWRGSLRGLVTRSGVRAEPPTSRRSADSPRALPLELMVSFSRPPASGLPLAPVARSAACFGFAALRVLGPCPKMRTRGLGSSDPRFFGCPD
jgi:hypothetical protein